MKHVARVLLAGVLLSIVLFNPADLPSCGPFFPTPVFTDQRIPALSEFVDGRLGVLHPTFDRRYLFIAYRYLSGQPLTKDEINALNSPASLQSDESSAEVAAPATSEWLRVRMKIPGLPQQSSYLEVHRNDSIGSNSEWRWFVNCTDDAFRTAARTLEKRIQSFGIESPEIKDWAISQDVVFSNCSRGASIPEDADVRSPQWFKHDRAYQIAAAYFYAENYDTAAAMFRAIAADKGSPWSALAPYLAVRCLLRKATVPQKYGEFDRAIMEEAKKELQSIQQDRDQAFLHLTARKLENFVDIRLNPGKHILNLSEKLRRPASADSFAQDLTDYLYLLSHAYTLKEISLDDACRASAMTDWILNFASADKAHALERWRTTGSPAWLLAVLVHLQVDDPEVPSVLKAVQAFQKNSPAFATAQYHRIRLLMESEKGEEARAALSTLLPGFRTTLQNGSLNLFLAQRLKLARSLDEFLTFAPRIPQANGSSLYPDLAEYTGASAALLDNDSSRVLNRALPLSLLSSAAVSKQLPMNIRKQLVRAAWTRAVLIGEDAAVAALSNTLIQLYPELESELKAWRKPSNAAEREFALALLLLHFPGMNPYLQSGVPPRGKPGGTNYLRENWWCGFNAGGDVDASTGSRYNFSRERQQSSSPIPAEFPAFLGESDRAEFRAEWKKLAALPTAPNYFGKAILAWAAKHPQDARVPEALHLVVKSTRVGCTDPESGKYSQAAFQMLHSRYPKSEWAASTPYWFK